MGDMTIKWEDFDQAMGDSWHSEEMEQQIRQTRSAGGDVWLLDENQERVGVVVLCQDGKFRGQKIMPPAVL